MSDVSQRRLVRAVRRSWRCSHLAAQIYRDLAARSADTRLSMMTTALAQAANDRAKQRGRMYRRLTGLKPVETLWERLAEGVLRIASTPCAEHVLTHLEQAELRAMSALLAVEGNVPEPTGLGD